MKYFISCGFVLFARTKGKVVFLLVHQRKGGWSFPKGIKEKNETDLETAKRELQEETGITDIKLLSETALTEEYTLDYHGELAQKTARYFIAEAKRCAVQIQQGEIVDHEWLTFEQALTTLQYESRKEILRKAYDAIREKL